MSDQVTPQTETWINRGQRSFVGNYRQLPVVIEKGEGAYLFDIEGNRYIDLVAGIAVTALGHGHPKLVAAVQEQAAKVLHTSNIYWNQPSVNLAEGLCQHSFGERVFFSNSGAEANECMLKLARRHFYDKGEGRFEFIAMNKSFHGRTLAGITVTGQEKYRVGFEPLLPGVRHVPFGDLEAIEAAISERTAGVLLEPIQGEGGIVVPPQGYLRGVRDLCTKHGCLMLLDEVQTGIGRTGEMFAYAHEGIEPDVMSLAKGLGGGLPVAATVTTAEIGAAMVSGTHGSTFGGNPIACAAAGVVLNEVSQPAFLQRVRELGEHTLARLIALQRQHKRVVVEARGKGLLCGLELNADASQLARRAMAKGLFLNVIGGKVVRIAPPLTIDVDVLDAGLDILDELLGELERE